MLSNPVNAISANAMTDTLSSTLSSALSGMGDASETAEAGYSSMPFSGLVKDAVKNMNTLDRQASDAVDGLTQGTGVDVHEAMIAVQKADLSSELVLAVRGKMVAAYQQVMSMQF
jgi:flagellar hook-basal body complex protein FliE